MEELVKLNGKTAGRDKIARLIQYACRALWDTLPLSERSNEYIDRLKSIEFILSSFRKLLRFGKCMDLLYASLKTVHNPDIIIRVTLTCSKLSQALFLYADHIVWLARSGLFKDIDLAKWNEMANKCWLFSIVMNLCRDLYELSKLLNTKQCGINEFNRTVVSACSIRTTQDLMKVTLKTCSAIHAHQSLVVDTMKNLCDVFIPLTSLGYTKLTPRTIGLLGVISSIAGLIAIVKPAAQLVPA